MAKAKFSPIALDQILSDAIEETEELQNELMFGADVDEDDIEDDIVPAPAVSPNINNLINDSNDGIGGQVDYARVYSQLEKLIENGNIALQVLGAIDPDVSGVEIATSTASLMNAVKNCVAEFTKIHMQHIKFQQSLQMMEMKHKYKMLELEKRKEIFNAKSNETSIINQPQELVEWETESATEYTKWLQQRNKKG
jgi:hypothetical protein